MNIVIIGGGNLGLSLLHKFTHITPSQSNHINNVTLLLTRDKKLPKTIFVHEYNGSAELVEQTTCDVSTHITQYKRVLCAADVILITTPKNILDHVLTDIAQYAQQYVTVGILPGGALSDIHAIKKLDFLHPHIFVTERIPFICRYNTGLLTMYRKSFIKIAEFGSFTRHTDMISEIMQVKFTQISHPIALTLNNSNPLLHTARLQQIIHDTNNGVLPNDAAYFYKDWSDAATENYIKMDFDLHTIIDTVHDVFIDDVIRVPSVLDHYNIMAGYHQHKTIISMLTARLQSYDSLKTIRTPLCLADDSTLTIDYHSRYILEDVFWGLYSILSFADMMHVKIADVKTLYTALQSFCKQTDADAITITDEHVVLNRSSNIYQDMQIPHIMSYGFKNIHEVADFYDMHWLHTQ